MNLSSLLIPVAVFAIALTGMAVGVLISNRRIKGSCGGLAGFKDEHGKSICEACTNPSPECRGERAREEAAREGAASTAE